MTDDEERVVAAVIASAVLHDDQDARIAAVRLLEYRSEVQLSLVYRTAYLVRDEALRTLIPDYPPLAQNDGETP